MGVVAIAPTWHIGAWTERLLALADDGPHMSFVERCILVNPLSTGQHQMTALRPGKLSFRRWRPLPAEEIDTAPGVRSRTALDRAGR